MTHSTVGQMTRSETEDQNNKEHQPRHSDKKVIAITCLRYVKDIGLIVSTFDGQIKVFDAFTFYQTWKNTNKQRSPAQHTTISSFDVSPSLGLMAVVGVEGRMLLIDPYA